MTGTEAVSRKEFRRVLKWSSPTFIDLIQIRLAVAAARFFPASSERDASRKNFSAFPASAGPARVARPLRDGLMRPRAISGASRWTPR